MALKIYDRRMIQLMEFYKKTGGVSYKQFLHSIGLEHDGNLPKIRSGEMSFTIKHVDTCIKKYKVNPGYFFINKEKM